MRILALSFFLISSLGFYEILNNQYHFLLNTAIFLLFYRLSKKPDNWLNGLIFSAGLLIKPLGLLFLPVFLFRRHLKTFLLGILSFIVISGVFWLLPQSQYYFQNLASVLKSSHADWDFFALLGRSFNFQVASTTVFKTSLILSITLIALIRRLSSFRWLLIMSLYSLLFYQNTFPYHHSLLAWLIPLGLLLGEIKLDKIEVVSLFLLALPAPLILIRLAVGEPALVYLSDEVEKLIFLNWTLFPELLLLLKLLFGRTNAKQKSSYH